jgi:hypothetical protein
MVGIAPAASRLLLPPRARSTGNSGQDSVSPRLALAARIAELADVETVEVPGDAMSFAVEVYLRQPQSALRQRLAPVPLCRINHTVIEVHGLDVRDRHHLMSRKWGRLHGTTVQLYQPRSEEELEACWFVIKRAYIRLVEALSVSSPGRATNWLGDLTEFSRTSLQ